MTQFAQAIDGVGRSGEPIPGLLRFSHQAMATVFEIFILHDDAVYAQQAAHEAFVELDRLEQELSRFIANSDISRINSLSANQSVRVGLAAFDCLQQCARLYKETDGAFDITIGPLLKCWLTKGKALRSPSAEEIEEARQRLGMRRLQLNDAPPTVRLLGDPVHIDLGGFGKGYAVDKMAELLREWDIDTALIHGGASSALALDSPPGREGWPVTLSHPNDRDRILARLELCNQSSSGSGLEKGRHIIDPRTAHPAAGNVAAWVLASGAATADALSTAFMVMSLDEVAGYCAQHQDTRALIIVGNPDGVAETENIHHFGRWEEEEITRQETA